ncbi:MAG TPA: VWA domain-containing protein [Galbitalea sp.]|jgi:hypothetical protein|nr:VWA domain-containing protein [Galbitalea sp.]
MRWRVGVVGVRGRLDRLFPRFFPVAVAVLVIAAVPFAGVFIGMAPADAAVPTPGATSSVVTVQTGADRQPAAIATPLPGVSLQLLDYTSGVPIAQSWSSCVSDAQGDCSFTVPDTAPGGANYNRRFLVAQVAAPAGYFQNSSLTLGALTGPFTPTTYRFATPAMRPGQTYASGSAFMSANGGTGAAQYQASTGVWQDSRTDPRLQGVCGLSVALVLDFSASVTAPQFVQLKQAAQSLVSALQGTPSSVAVYTFGTGASENISLTPVASAAQAADVSSRIAALSQPASQFTNWDAAFQRVASSGQHFDEAIMITDGNPTLSGSETGNGSTRFSAVENGIFSANALKAEGTRIVGIGVGAGINGSSDNLAAISGPTAGQDYFQAADYTSAGTELKTLAQGDCIPTVTVVKQVIPNGGTLTDAHPASGWAFAVAATGATVTGSPGTTAEGTGAVNFPLGFPTPADTATVQITEQPTPAQSGFTYLAADTVCTDIATGATVTTSPAGSGSFSLSMAGDQGVSCTIYNQEPPATTPSTLEVDKIWDVDGTNYPDGTQPDGLTAGLTLDGAGAEFDTVYGGYENEPSVAIGETTQLSLPLCTLTGSSLQFNGGPHPLGPVTLAEGDNTATLTNTVDCTSQLTLIKEVEGGNTDPASWTLTGVGPPGALPGPNGASGTAQATATVTPGAQYALVESGGDPRYTQVDNRDPADTVAGSTGSWDCAPRVTGGQLDTDDDAINGGVQVPLGQWVQCTAINQTATLTLTKTLDNAGGGTKTPADWTLTATPDTAIAGLPAEQVTGSPTGTAVDIRPGDTYQLSETGPADYQQSSLQCDTGPGGQYVTTSTVDATPLADLTCQFVNVYDPGGPPASESPNELAPTGTPATLPLTVGVVLLLGGLGFLATNQSSVSRQSTRPRTLSRITQSRV